MTRLSYISPKAMVRDSPIHGRGLFAVEPMTKGDIVAIKGGYIYDRARRDVLQPQLGPAEIPIADGFFIGPMTEDEREGGMIFSNHSCDPNSEVRSKWDHEANTCRAWWIALRDIAVGEEITYDYAFVGEAAEPCACGTLKCRGLIVDPDPVELAKLPDHLRRLLRLQAA